MENNNLKDVLGGSRSILNVDAQKELIDHRIKAGTRGALKMFFIIFPTIFIFMGIMMYALFKFVGLIK